MNPPGRVPGPPAAVLPYRLLAPGRIAAGRPGVKGHGRQRRARQRRPPCPLSVRLLSVRRVLGPGRHPPYLRLSPGAGWLGPRRPGLWRPPRQGGGRGGWRGSPPRFVRGGQGVGPRLCFCGFAPAALAGSPLLRSALVSPRGLGCCVGPGASCPEGCCADALGVVAPAAALRPGLHLPRKVQTLQCNASPAR